MDDASNVTPGAGAEAGKPRSRIQLRNRARILEAALEVFSANGFRGSTLDQIALAAGISKPNILYYFAGKEDIHVTLLGQLVETWLAPLEAIDADGDPQAELLGYIALKLEMSREMPRESRLFANEILQGAPRISPMLSSRLKDLIDEKAGVIAAWSTAGQIPPVNPRHLIFSIWATTQHYADFETQVAALSPPGEDVFVEADRFLKLLYGRLLGVK